jgi:hypothetical protein
MVNIFEHPGFLYKLPLSLLIFEIALCVLEKCFKKLDHSWKFEDFYPNEFSHLAELRHCERVFEVFVIFRTLNQFRDEPFWEIITPATRDRHLNI